MRIFNGFIASFNCRCMFKSLAAAPWKPPIPGIFAISSTAPAWILIPSPVASKNLDQAPAIAVIKACSTFSLACALFLEFSKSSTIASPKSLNIVACRPYAAPVNCPVFSSIRIQASACAFAVFEQASANASSIAFL